jgi:diaminohydroxyphosphoribosylaminopyrimidine deaminase/5-amino-6-(5-phosphoribosylamino)uracil reductase
MEGNYDDKFMRRCLDLASVAEGRTYPNPLVGSVIVHDGKIIGEGFHMKAGEPHAEVNAINSVKHKDILRESTLYVNLEPCSHFGKTPPCADLIIKCKIPRVVVGAIDTSGKVQGKGIEKLKTAGIEVVTGVLENESRWINRRFFSFNEKKRPWVILKWAQTADGYMDIIRTRGMTIRPTWISGKPERILVHRWRSFEQAILVGAGTVRTDNPQLNVREWEGSDPLKLVLSSSGNFIHEHPEEWIVFTHNPELVQKGAKAIRLIDDEQSCFQISDFLFNTGIQSLFIEGGSMVLNHFINAGLWDEARVFISRNCFGSGIKAPDIRGKLISEKSFTGSMLHIYSNE